MPCTFATPCSPYVLDLTHARTVASYGMTSRLYRCINGHAYWPDKVEVARRVGPPVGSTGPRPVKPASSRRRLTAEERGWSLDRRHAAKDVAMAGIGKR